MCDDAVEEPTASPQHPTYRSITRDGHKQADHACSDGAGPEEGERKRGEKEIESSTIIDR